MIARLLPFAIDPCRKDSAEVTVNFRRSLAFDAAYRFETSRSRPGAQNLCIVLQKACEFVAEATRLARVLIHHVPARIAL